MTLLALGWSTSVVSEKQNFTKINSLILCTMLVMTGFIGGEGVGWWEEPAMYVFVCVCECGEISVLHCEVTFVDLCLLFVCVLSPHLVNAHTYTVLRNLKCYHLFQIKTAFTRYSNRY